MAAGLFLLFTYCLCNAFGVVSLQSSLDKREEQLSATESRLSLAQENLAEERQRLQEQVGISDKLESERDELREQNEELRSTIQEVEAEDDFMTYAGDFQVTYYCGENYPHICGTGNGITASGQQATQGITVAADPDVIPMGSYIYIEGVGMRIVQDTGGAIAGNKLDVYVDTHQEALAQSVRTAKVWIVQGGA